jgi:muconate cycloisomerase
MKITSIEAIPVRVPLKSGMTTKTAHGDHVTSNYVIVRVHTDQGLAGLGEATVSALWTGETSTSCVSAINDYLAPAVVGSDPRRVHVVRSTMDRAIKANLFTKSAIEMALWDLAGKAAGVPVYDLLGGKIHDEIPIKMMIGAFDVPRAVALAERFLSWGVRCLKVKVGIALEDDVARVESVRSTAGPNIPITVDANCGWNATIARQALTQLRASNLLIAEQPIPPGDPSAMAELRRTCGIPIMADESVFTLADAWTVAEARAADVISIYPGKNGGIAASIEIAHVAKAAGLACHVGSNLELGIASAAMLHLAAAVDVIDSHTYPADILGPLYHEGDLLHEPLRIGPETARVPDGPGLGIELDEEQLKRWRVD